MEATPKRKWISLAGDNTKKPVKKEVENMRPLFFKDWFNEKTLSDLVIHSSPEPDARKYYCHKFIISCACPVLYEKMMATKFESTSESDFDHALLVDPLADKDEQMVQYFFQVLYNTNLVTEDSIKPNLSNLAQLYKESGATDLSEAIMEASGRIGSSFAPNIEKFCPKLGQDTPLGDITLYFNKEKSLYIKAHRIMLANYSSYFKGLFMSGMKDSTTHETVISLESDVKNEQIAKYMESLLSFIYDRNNLTLFVFSERSAEEIIAMHALASKYIFDAIKTSTEYYLTSYPAMNYVEPALRYDNQVALMSATKALIEVILSIDLTTLPVDYLNVVRYTDNQNLFHAIVENEFQPGSEPRIRQIQALQKHLGSAAQIKITDLDDNNTNCLHCACRDAENNRALIALLIEEKLDVNAVNKAKERPLEIALQSWRKTSYEPASVRAEKKRRRKAFSALLDGDSDEDEEKDLKITAIDQLLLAGAKVDLSNTENVQNLLCFASSFENNRSAVSWKKVTEMLLTLPKEKILAAKEHEFFYLFLQQKYKFPISFFLGQLNLAVKIKATVDKKETVLEINNTSEITFNGKSRKVKGMKVQIEVSKILSRVNLEITNYLSFTIIDGVKKYKFEHTDEAAAAVTGIVAYVNGKKSIKENVVDKR